MVSRSSFHAPRNNPDKAQGVAGRSFFRGDVTIVEDLPDVTGESLAVPVVTDYARRTWSDVDSVYNRRPRARSYVGMRVSVNREPWGVLIIDSTEQKAKIEPADLRAYALVADFVGTILE